MALALIHHLAISNNVSFLMLAEWFASLSEYLIMEFVPKDDSQVQLLLNTRIDIFPDYNQQNFESQFSEYYEIIEMTRLEDSKRTMYLFRRKNA